MYALYKNMSLSVSFSGDEGCKQEANAEIEHFLENIRYMFSIVARHRRWQQLDRGKDQTLLFKTFDW